jgi:hypothetical protein
MPGIHGGSLPAQIFRDFILRAQGDEPFRPAPPPRKPREAPLVDALGDLVDDVVDSIRGWFGN